MPSIKRVDSHMDKGKQKKGPEMNLIEWASKAYWHCEEALDVSTQKQVRGYAQAPFYVFARDKVLSGWGLAKGGYSYIIISTPNRKVADLVATICKKESDLCRVVVRDFVPPVLPGVHNKLYNAISGPRFFGIMKRQANYRRNRELLQASDVPFEGS